MTDEHPIDPKPKKVKRGHGEGSFGQRADGTWYASKRVGWEGGKRKRIVKYGKTKAEAMAKLRRAEDDHRKGISTTSGAVTVEQFLNRWLEDVVKQTNRASTYRSYEQIARVHLIPGVGKVRLQELNPQHVQAMLTKVGALQRSPRTVQYVRAVLRIALNQAIKWGMIERNAAALAIPPAAVRYQAQVLDVEQARSFLAAVKGERLEALFVVGLSLGLRHGEALALRWKDVNLVEGTLRIDYTLHRTKGEFTFGEPKSASSRRVVSMPDVLIRELKAHRARQNQERLRAGAGWQDHDLVFASTIGTPLDMTNNLRELRRVLEANDLPKLRFHDLRHTAATLLLAQGVEPRLIMDSLGHAQVSTTLNLYAHVLPSMRKDVAGRMNDLLSGPESTKNEESK
jgi:integrase